MHHALAPMIVVLALSLCATPALAGPLPARSANPRPVVIGAAVDRLEPDRLVIRGMHFGVASAPVVLLSKVSLEVLSFSDEQIVVRLPIDAPPARYRLQVLAHGARPSPLYDVTVERRPGRGIDGPTSHAETSTS